MKNAFRTTLAVFRVTGLAQIVLGILFWTGHGLNLIPLHSAIGSVFVLMLWVMAGLGARAGAPGGLVIAAVACGLIVPALGMTQARWLPGDWHWVIRTLHLLTGVAALAVGGRLAARLGFTPRRAAPPRPIVVGWPEGGSL